MSSTKLATCFAPVLLKPPPMSFESQDLASLNSMRNIASHITALHILIENADEVDLPPEEDINNSTNLTKEMMAELFSLKSCFQGLTDPLVCARLVLFSHDIVFLGFPACAVSTH